ncbi:hypothetical protein X777_00697 [Ooceraea biroi]|uniref:Uncharacterized protein n=1 Tax=Ooceraea biroi TaxID=2015173 RepID=A0A026VVL6_OOCBI|nr:hypothetical protein X777_00697 [Ooceraea biroi]
MIPQSYCSGGYTIHDTLQKEPAAALGRENADASPGRNLSGRWRIAEIRIACGNYALAKESGARCVHLKVKFPPWEFNSAPRRRRCPGLALARTTRCIQTRPSCRALRFGSGRASINPP